MYETLSYFTHTHMQVFMSHTHTHTHTLAHTKCLHADTAFTYAQRRGKRRNVERKRHVTHRLSRNTLVKRKQGEIFFLIFSFCFSQCLLLENVRFYAEEEKNDKSFSKKLAAPFDMYVNAALVTTLTYLAVN